MTKKSSGRSLRSKTRNAGILLSTSVVLALLLIAAAVMWVLFNRLLRDAWPWDIGGLDTATPGFQLTQLVLTLVGGIGAAILVIVAYRRQRDLEAVRFDERFAAAATQLGSDTAAERLAGVYAMAALADMWEKHRQQCIAVLCGYLRLPYNPEPGSALLASISREGQTVLGYKETRTFQYLPRDKEVRHTIIRVIVEHLREGGKGQSSAVSWQGYDLDFTGVVFDGGDFSEAQFSEGSVSFEDAEFAGGVISFRDAKFAGGTVSFLNAKFLGGIVNYSGAEFAGSAVNYSAAKFLGALVVYDQAKLTAGTISYRGAEFSVGRVNYTGVGFAGSEVVYDGACFGGAMVSYQNAKFTGGSVTYDRAEFADGSISFPGATFEVDGKVTRDGIDFRGWHAPRP